MGSCAGRCTEDERDRIEEQAGRYLRSCQENITRLEALNQGEAQQGQRGVDNDVPNATVIAHRHGVVTSMCSMLLGCWGLWSNGASQ